MIRAQQCGGVGITSIHAVATVCFRMPIRLRFSGWPAGSSCGAKVLMISVDNSLRRALRRCLHSRW
jgi:hypothetical protein